MHAAVAATPAGASTQLITRQIAYILLGASYAIALYGLYPIFFDWHFSMARRWQPHSLDHVIVVGLFILLILVVSSFVKDGLFSLFNTLLLVTFYIPFFIITLYYRPDSAFADIALAAAASSLLLSLIGVAAGSMRMSPLGHSRIGSQRLITLLCIASSAIIVVILVRFRNILSWDALTDVFATRRRYTDGVGTIAYLVNWQMVVLTPMLLWFGIRQRRIDAVLIATAATATIFLVTAHRLSVAIFALVLVFSVFPLLSRLLRSKVFLVAVALAVLLVTTAVDLHLYGAPLLTPMAVNRTLLAHGTINVLAVEHFSSAPKALWSASFLRYFIDPVYSEDPFMLLGRVYFRAGIRANTNFFGDGFINLGIPGALLMTALTGLVLVISTMVYSRQDQGTIVLFLPAGMALLNTPLQVTLLTNGLILLWLILLVAPADRVGGERGAAWRRR